MKIFRTGSGQSQTMLRFGFDPRTDVFGFCCEFWYHSDMVTNETKNGSQQWKGPKGALFVWVRDLGPFCVLLLD